MNACTRPKYTGEPRPFLGQKCRAPLNRVPFAPKRRWFLNTLMLLVVGPLVGLLFFGAVWVVDRPNEIDAWPMFRAILSLGFVAGLIACSVYWVSLAWARFTNQDG